VPIGFLTFTGQEGYGASHSKLKMSTETKKENQVASLIYNHSWAWI
jgi:hypothetical protein